MLTFDQYTSLIEQMSIWAKAYYKDGAPIISDQEWDARYKELSDFELENPSLINPLSPVGKVGFAMFGESGVIRHHPTMLSLKNAMTIDDAETLIETQLKGSGPYVIEYKADGVACRLHYDNGQFKRALTRGDGEYGEDITRHIDPVLIGIPTTIDCKYSIMVDGELIIKYKDFDKLNEYRLNSKQDSYKNTRNAVAGMLGSDETSVEQKKAISFLAYDLHDKLHRISWLTNRELLRKYGFELVDKEESTNFKLVAKNINDLRPSLKYMIDGLVVKLDLYSMRDRLGNTQHSPRWAFSYKFPAVTNKAVLESVGFTVGRTGQITGMVYFSPVDIGGVTITKSAIDSIDRWVNLKPSKGAVLTISRRADVRPYVESCESVGGSYYAFTALCPWCNSKLVVKGKKIFCINDTCRGRTIAHITYAVSKTALNIDDLSEQKVTLLCAGNAIGCVAHLYSLTPEILQTLGFTKYGADKLIKEISKSKNTTLERVITSLGIPLIATTASAAIAQYMRDNKLGGVNEMLDLLTNSNEVAKLPIGEAAKDCINTYFTVPFYALNASFYKNIKFVIKSLSGALEGKYYCITGSLKTISRSDLEKRLIGAGATLQSSVTHHTTALITDDPSTPPWEEMPSVKMQKAVSLGVSIITSDEALKLL